MRSVAVLGIIALCSTYALAQEASRWRFDFEDGAPGGLRLMGAEVTDDDARVLEGERSLLADFGGKPGEWHEFLHTEPAVRFEKGRTYAVRFRYRVIRAEDKEVKFYSQIRSRAGKGDIQGDHWMWHMPTGQEGHINRLFEVTHEGGYYFMIGVRGPGAVVIDEIEIREPEPNAGAKGMHLRTLDSPVNGRREAFDKLARMQRMSRLVDNLLVITLDEGAGEKARSRKDQIAEELQPDFVDWNIFGPLAKSYGIRSSTGGCEYQEYYKFEGDTDPEKREQIWNNRYRIFGDSGFVVTLENTFLADESWGEGGYFTCHNGDNWHHHFLDTLTRKAKQFLAITQDNIACSVFNRVRGCYCRGCQGRFRNILQEQFTPGELSALGITDVEAFSIQDYIVDHAAVGRAALDDAVVRAYIKFQYISGLLAWAHCVEEAKGIARRQGRALPCGGNQINIWGTWPYAVILSQFCDFVEIEELVGIKDQVTSRSLQYKMGLASGHHVKPVWVRGPVTDDTQEKMPMLNTAYWRIHFAEGLANGGVREFSLGINKPWTGEPGTKDFIDDAELYQLYIEVAAWMHAHRALLTHRESMARTAVVYSLPALMFRRYDALRTPDDHRLPRFSDTVSLLERNHVPCDVIVLGHPELWDDAPAFERLKDRYGVVLLPGVDAMTDDQIKQLEACRNAGIRLLADQAVAFDENLNPRPRPAELKPDALSDESAVDAGREASVVRVENAERVTVNVWRSCRGKSLDVHLVNYAADLPAERIEPARDIRVRVRVPDDLEVERCLVSQLGADDEEIHFEQDGDWVSAVLPRLEAYAILSFTDQRSIASTQRLLEAQRRADILQVKKQAARDNLY